MRSSQLSLFFIISLLLFISSSSANPNSATTPASSPQKIHIAASLALTGPLSHVGVGHLRGLQLGIAEINSAGGINGHEVNLLVEDNFADPKTAISHFNRFASMSPQSERPVLLLTHFSHIVDSVASIAHKAQIPLLYSASTLKPLSIGPLIYQDYCVSEDGGAHIAKHFNSHNFKRVGFLTENTASCLGAEDTFKKLFKGLIVAEERYNSGTSDFRSSLVKLKSSTSDALIFCAWKDSAHILKQMKQLGMGNIHAFFYVAPLIGDSAELRDIFEKMEATSTWYGVMHNELESPSATPQQKEFLAKFKEKFKEPPYLPDAAIAYDDTWVIKTALQNCLKSPSEPASPKIDNNCFNEQMITIKKDNGVSGPISFGPDRATNREIFNIQVKKGKWQRVEVQR